MLPYIHIFGWTISAWRVLVIDGVVLCWILFLVRARNRRFPFTSVFLWLVLGLPAGALGGHLFNKVIPLIVGAAGASQSFTGLTVLGSIIACLTFSYFYITYVMKVPWTPLLDAVSFTFPLSIFIGRIGCLLSGCCYGKPVSDALKTSMLSVLMVPVGFYAEDSTARHDYGNTHLDNLIWNLPVLLMINAVIALAVSETLYRRRERWQLHPGTVFSATGTLYAGGRFFIEFLRKEEGAGTALFNPWQIAVAVLFLFFAGWLSACLYRRSRTITQKKETLTEAHP